MKPLVTLFVFFTTFSALLCQNDTTDVFSKKKLDYSHIDWNSFSMTIGFNRAYTEGGIKNFIEPIFAMNGGFDVQYKRRYFALGGTGYSSKLKQTFINKDKTWQRDTSVGITLVQGTMGYQIWATKRWAMYVFGSLGFADLSVDKSDNNNNGVYNNCNDTHEKGGKLYSPALSAGCFIEYRKIWINKNPYHPYWDNYWRLQFKVSPVWFSKIGNGTLYDIGLSYSFGIFQ